MIALLITLTIIHFCKTNCVMLDWTDALFPEPIMKMSLFQQDIVFQQVGNRRKLNEFADTELSGPLFEGLGTHYSFIWVGSPPQRVSVIVDTGSHHTAFPCVGCKCGKHVFALI